MANVRINSISVHYSQSGDDGRPVLLLHGWGQNIAMMKPIETHLASAFRVYNLDLPGFGQSEEPLTAWSVYDYANFVKEFIDHFKLNDPILIAHSFGARLAIIYASEHPVHKLIITGGAGIRDKRGIDYYAKVYAYKAAKKGLELLKLNRYKERLQSRSGSSDYRQTSGVMRQSFVKIVNEDLTRHLKDIRAETLLVWGEKDEATPLWMGKKMEELIPHAGLAIFENDGHYAYYHQTDRFLRVLDIFLKEDRVD